MSAEVFLDSNVRLYSCSAAADDAAKRQVAEDLILNRPFAISAQVRQDLIASALRKPRPGITESNIEATLQMAALVRVQPITHELVIAAVTLRRRFQFSQSDATIIAGVRIINPFKQPAVARNDPPGIPIKNSPYPVRGRPSDPAAEGLGMRKPAAALPEPARWPATNHTRPPFTPPANPPPHAPPPFKPSQIPRRPCPADPNTHSPTTRFHALSPTHQPHSRFDGHSRP